VVCVREGASVVFMQSGSNICPGASSLEYAGYLMSSHYAFDRSEFICVDRDMTAASGGTGPLGGTVLYPTEIQCSNGLPCPPYVHGREMTCGVCSQ
jgi:hypothetical protein